MFRFCAIAMQQPTKFLSYSTSHRRSPLNTLGLSSRCSDDRFDPDCLKGFLSMLREHAEEGNQADLVINDYVYDRPGKQAVYRIRYSRMFPARKLITWRRPAASSCPTSS